MNTDRHGFHLPKGRLTYEIVGAAMAVLNGLGHGLHEKPYENALVVELRARNIACSQQLAFAVTYRDVVVGEYIPDLVVGREVIVDTKVVGRITDVERGQILNYLKVTRLSVGLVLNFNKPKLEWERIVL